MAFSDLIALMETLFLFAMVFNALRRSRGTTLVYPLVWALVACGALAWAAWNHFTPWTTYVAGAFTFCPALALLGAKRPQHHGWNFVVATLLGVLLYPLVQSSVLRPGESFDLGTVWPWLLLVMMFVTPVLYFGTRYAPAALMVGLAQIFFFAPYLPVMGQRLAHSGLRGEIALGTLVVATIVAEMLYRRRPPDFHPADLLWLDFRDSFGLFWSLRWTERINEEAVRFNWPVRLEWGGFVVDPADSRLSLEEALNQALAAQLRSSMRGVLRRFVDSRWIEARLPRRETSD